MVNQVAQLEAVSQKRSLPAAMVRKRVLPSRVHGPKKSAQVKHLEFQEGWVIPKLQVKNFEF